MSSPGVVTDGFHAVAESSQDTTIGVISQRPGKIIASYGIHNQDITQESLQDAEETIHRSSSDSLTVTHQIVASQDDFHSVVDQRPHRDARTIQLAIGHSHTYPIVEEVQDDFNSDTESVTTPLNPDTTDANATSNYSPNSTRVEEQPPFDHARLTKIFLAITSQMAQTMLTIRTSAGSTGFSENQKILFRSAAALNAVGLLSFLSAIPVHGRRPRFARIVTGTGFFCTAYAFIIIMGMTLLNDSEMLWVTILVSMAYFPVFACVFME